MFVAYGAKNGKLHFRDLQERLATYVGETDNATSVLDKNFDVGKIVTGEDVETMLANKLSNKYSHVRDAFRLFDEDKSGTISYDEFASVLSHYGMKMTTEEFHTLAKKFDSDGDGAIAYEEFVR